MIYLKTWKDITFAFSDGYIDSGKSHRTFTRMRTQKMSDPFTLLSKPSGLLERERAISNSLRTLLGAALLWPVSRWREFIAFQDAWGFPLPVVDLHVNRLIFRLISICDQHLAFASKLNMPHTSAITATVILCEAIRSLRKSHSSYSLFF